MSEVLGNNMGEDDDETGTTLPAAAPVPKKAASKKAPAAAPTGPKRVRIILEENDNIPPTGQFFGVNGRGSIIRPGEEVEVPPEIIEVLNNAEMSVPLVDPNTQQVVGYRKKLRFPYRVIAKDI